MAATIDRVGASELQLLCSLISHTTATAPRYIVIFVLLVLGERAVFPRTRGATSTRGQWQPCSCPSPSASMLVIAGVKCSVVLLLTLCDRRGEKRRAVPEAR